MQELVKEVTVKNHSNNRLAILHLFPRWYNELFISSLTVSVLMHIRHTIHYNAGHCIKCRRDNIGITRHISDATKCSCPPLHWVTAQYNYFCHRPNLNTSITQYGSTVYIGIAMGCPALYRYGLHYNVLLQMIMSVLQQVKGLTKKLYFIILPVGRPVSMPNFRLHVYTVYLFLHRYGLHYVRTDNHQFFMK